MAMVLEGAPVETEYAAVETDVGALVAREAPAWEDAEGDAVEGGSEAAGWEAQAAAGVETDASGGGTETAHTDASGGGTEPLALESDTPDPDPEALEELEEELVTLAAEIAMAEHRFLMVVAEFDRRGGWKRGGYRSASHWLHENTALKLRTAYQRVEVARALEKLPETSRAMAEGRISYSQARILAREATAECEGQLLEVAKYATVAELEGFVDEWRALSAADEDALERARWRRRGIKVEADEEGMYRVNGALPAEVGAVVAKALEAAEEALFRGEAKKETTKRQRRADALGLLAERALLAGLDVEPEPDPEAELEAGDAEESGVDDGAECTRVHNSEAAEPASADRGGSEGEECARVHSSKVEPGGAEGGGPEAAPAPLTGSRAERFQAFLHLDPTTLADTADPGHSYLEGIRLAPETTRRLTCDGALVPVRTDEEGRVLDMGRRRRTVPPALRRALEVRDGGSCRFPGCEVRHTEPHHIQHWAQGGRTELVNLLSLCRYHHRLVHDEGWEIHVNRRQEVAVFVDPKGEMRASELPGRRRKGLADVARRARAGGRTAVADGERTSAGEEKAVDSQKTAADGEKTIASSERDAVGGEKTAARREKASDGESRSECTRAHTSGSAHALVARNRRRGAAPDGNALRPAPHPDRLRGDSGEIPWSLQARALEALDDAHFGGAGGQANEEGPG